MSVSSLGSAVTFMQQLQSVNAQNTQMGIQQVQSGADARSKVLDTEYQLKLKTDNQVLAIQQAVPGRVDTWA